MSEVLEIYGTKIKVPEYNGIVEDWGTDVPSEQYWRKKELPPFFKDVDYDKDGNALLNSQQRDYALEEVRRCKEGFAFMNNGVKTYITGKNYFYLQFWKLENDVFPDYRDTDRRYFLFLNHWENTPWCLGIVRGKKRREGATSQATSNLIYECIFFKNSFCGLTSKTEKDAKTAFTSMVAFGYRQLPVFLKPKQLNNKDSVTELVFAHKSVDVKGAKGSVIDTDTGHRSKIDYRAPGKNAYDSGRLSRLLADEMGKWAVENPASEFLAIVSKTMVQGTKRVGFCELPSTVNELSKGGGAEFKKIWDLADHFKLDRTTNRIVRYFTPAFDGYVGFIDKHGISVIDPPNEEQYKYLVENFVGMGDLTESDVRLGARDYLISKRVGLDGVALEEEIRMNPFDEREMFMSALTGCIYNSFKLNEQLDWLSWNPMIERGNLVWETGDKFYKQIEISDGTIHTELSKLKWVKDDNGKYEKVKGWIPKEENNVYEKNGFFIPNGNYAIRIGADPFKYDKTKENRKSNCAAYAYQMPDYINKDYEFNDTFVMRYVDRPSTTDLANEYVLRMAWYCGCKVLFERNVNHWKSYFASQKCSGFLMWLSGEVEPGIYTDGKGGVVQTICDYTESYIEKDIQKVYFKELLGDKSGWLGFEVGDTQRYDDAMGAGFALIAAKEKRQAETIKKHNIDNIMPYRQAI
mgnify:FL=1|jgi:hypothetical protein